MKFFISLQLNLLWTMSVNNIYWSIYWSISLAIEPQVWRPLKTYHSLFICLHIAIEKSLAMLAPRGTLRLLRKHTPKIKISRILCRLSSRITDVALSIQTLGNLHGIYRRHAKPFASRSQQLHCIQSSWSLLSLWLQLHFGHYGLGRWFYVVVEYVNHFFVKQVNTWPLDIEWLSFKMVGKSFCLKITLVVQSSLANPDFIW